MEQWSRLKAYLQETENIEIWKVENFITDHSITSLSSDFKKVSFDTYDKCSTSNNRTYSSMLEEGSWKYRPSEAYQTEGEKEAYPLGNIKS